MFSGLNVHELKAFLRQKGARLSGNKDELLKRARLYADQKDLEVQEKVVLSDEQKYFDSSTLNWKIPLGRHHVPKQFKLEVLTLYLKQNPMSLHGCLEPETETGTSKPAEKGRNMYYSHKIHLFEGAEENKVYYFRANVEKSLDRKKFCYPHVSILQNGKISAARCTCVAMASARCCHIAALLFLLEELTHGCDPKLFVPSTSKLQYYGKGSVRASNSQSIGAPGAKYSKKFCPGRFSLIHVLKNSRKQQEKNLIT